MDIGLSFFGLSDDEISESEISEGNSSSEEDSQKDSQEDHKIEFNFFHRCVYIPKRGKTKGQICNDDTNMGADLCRVHQLCTRRLTGMIKRIDVCDAALRDIGRICELPKLDGYHMCENHVKSAIFQPRGSLTKGVEKRKN